MSRRPDARGIALAMLCLSACSAERTADREALDSSGPAAPLSSPSAGPLEGSVDPIVTRSLEIRFVAGGGDSLTIEHACTGSILASFAAEEGGFVRGLVPTLLQERRIRRLDPDAAYLLNQDVEGHLYIADPAAGTRIDLEAFGPDAVRLFRPFLSEDADPGVLS